jgi:predicted RNase H-like HicB family nuclease
MNTILSQSANAPSAQVSTKPGELHHDDGTYWAEVPELPGVFASGDTVDELLDGLKEAVALYLGDGENSATELSELKLAVTA